MKNSLKESINIVSNEECDLSKLPLKHDVYHNEVLLGQISFTQCNWMVFTSVLGNVTAVCTVEDWDQLTEMLSGNKDRIKTLLLSGVPEFKNIKEGILSEENLTFKHRDPANIGNGLHDYDVSYEGNIIGKLLFPNNSPEFMKSWVIFIINGPQPHSINLCQMSQVLEGTSSNEEVLNKVTPGIISLFKDESISAFTHYKNNY